jgi:hypothetical protein
MFKIDLKTKKVYIDTDKMEEYLDNRIISKIDDFFSLFFKEKYSYKAEINYNKNNNLVYDVNIKIGIPLTKELMSINYHLEGKKKGVEIEDYKLNPISLTSFKNKKILKKFLKEVVEIINKEIDLFFINYKNEQNSTAEQNFKF